MLGIEIGPDVFFIRTELRKYSKIPMSGVRADITILALLESFLLFLDTS